MPHPELEDRLYTSSEVAKLLGVSLRSLYRYIKSGKLKPETTTLSGRHRFSKEQIEKFLYPKPGGSPATARQLPGRPTPLERSETPSERSESRSEPPKPLERSETSPEAPSEAEESASREARETLKPIADDGEIVKEAEIQTASPEPIPPSPPSPPKGEEEPVSEPTPEDLEKLRVEALKKVSSEEPRHLEEHSDEGPKPTPPSPPERSEASSSSRGKPPQEEEPQDKEIPPLSHRERVFEIEEEQPKPSEQSPAERDEAETSSSSRGETSQEDESTPLNGFSHFDKKCQYFYSPVGDLKQIAQKIHQFASNAGKKYAFTLLAGLSLHQEVPPFSLIHIYLKEPDFAFFKGVLKLIPKPKEEANIGIIFEEDRQFWDKTRTINDYYVASDNRLRDDLHNYSSETRDLAKEFKPST